ncbi:MULTISPECIES: hypothetical protein [Aeromonas]|uniref:hypothetical protein n=1 Tax=Aeromonas TaxID=642 RepID=UPI000AF724E5|nr:MULTISPECIES: hypothetical protein [Aeromonas]
MEKHTDNNAFEQGFNRMPMVERPRQEWPRRQRRRSVIPPILPRLVSSQSGTFLVYGGFRHGIKIPVSPEQASRHLECLMQLLREVSHG